MKTKNEKGFTVIELVIAIVVLTTLTVFFIIQKTDLESTYYDQQRKTAINAMYYSLTDVYFPEHGYYPSSIEENTLKALDPDMLTDPYGTPIYEENSEYRYEGLNCDGEGKCKQFKLTVELEKEPEFVKESE